jgi:phage baseplate assembly protein V
MNMLNAIERLWRRIQLVVGRGRIKTSNDAGNVQMIQVQLGADEIRDNTPRLAEYGFTSNPLPDADAVIIFAAGDRSNGVIIATGDQRYRLRNLAPGEVALYSDEGDYVRFQRGRKIKIVAGTSVEIDTPLLKVSGDVIDNYQTNVHTMAQMRSIYNTHTHSGVQTGAGNSGPPNQTE